MVNNQVERDESQYLQLCHKMLEKIKAEGFQTADRTGDGTCKVFGAQMRFDLQKGFPLFTHKQVFMRGIFEELMWFLRGETNIQILLLHGVHIWSEWRHKDYLQFCEAMGLDKPTLPEFEKKIVEDDSFAKVWGDIGKGYGHQWRRFGEIKKKVRFGSGVEAWTDDVVTKEGFDQIDWVINEIKRNPNSRRLLVTGWNPHDADKVDLPPCHTLFQFFVEKGKLSCQLYQRSADLLLGVPFNIASYALLTHLVAAECGLEVGEFIWTGGDIHIYTPQLAGLEEICYNRYSLPAPKFKLRRTRLSVDQYQWQDIIIEDYNHLGKIKMPVSV